MKYLQELREGEHISQVYLCKSKTSAVTKAGKTYYSLVLQDKTGQMDGKIWELGGAIDYFEPMQFIKIDADVTVFAGNPQLKISRVRQAMEGEYVSADYFPVSTKDPKEMYQELLGYIKQMKNPYIKKLAESFFVDDADFIRRFTAHSAAKSVHHGFIGGLLEHTLSVTKLCNFYCMQYPELNYDLLLVSAMCHDIGKIEELSSFPENDYTDDGQLIGHIVIGCGMVRDHIKEIPNFPPRMASQIQHCILSHHGELEYGSPKKPALMEAIALAFADNTDAKLETMREALSNAQNDDWLGFNRFVDSNIRRTISEE